MVVRGDGGLLVCPKRRCRRHRRRRFAVIDSAGGRGSGKEGGGPGGGSEGSELVSSEWRRGGLTCLLAFAWPRRR